MRLRLMMDDKLAGSIEEGNAKLSKDSAKNTAAIMEMLVEQRKSQASIRNAQEDEARLAAERDRLAAERDRKAGAERKEILEANKAHRGEILDAEAKTQQMVQRGVDTMDAHRDEILGAQAQTQQSLQLGFAAMSSDVRVLSAEVARLRMESEEGKRSEEGKESTSKFSSMIGSKLGLSWK